MNLFFLFFFYLIIFYYIGLGSQRNDRLEMRDRGINGTDDGDNSWGHSEFDYGWEDSSQGFLMLTSIKYFSVLVTSTSRLFLLKK